MSNNTAHFKERKTNRKVFSCNSSVFSRTVHIFALSNSTRFDDLTLLTLPLFWANKVKCLRYSDDIRFGFELILFLSFRPIHTCTLQPPSQIIDVVVCKNSKLEHQHFLFKCPFVTLSMEKEVVKIWMNCVPASLKHAGNGSAKFNPNKKRTK